MNVSRSDEHLGPKTPSLTRNTTGGTGCAIAHDRQPRFSDFESVSPAGAEERRWEMQSVAAANAANEKGSGPKFRLDNFSDPETPDTSGT